MQRDRLIRRALVLSCLSIVLSGLAGITAVVAGLASGSLVLAGFGLDATLDAAASVSLVWRFAIEARDPERADRVERTAQRNVGLVLLGIAAYLVVGAVNTLIRGGRPEQTVVGFVLLVFSVLLLPGLALAKYRLASELGSHALRADGILTAMASLLAAISLVSLALSSGLGVNWADPLGAFVVAALLVREGWASARSGRP